MILGAYSAGKPRLNRSSLDKFPPRDHQIRMDRRTFMLGSSSFALGGALALLGPPSAEATRRDRSIPLPKLKPGGTIVIDPGHGGIDPGAIGPSGTQEKNVVLPLAEALAAELEALSGASVRMTREKDVFLSLTDRVAVAQSVNADLLISVHADSCPVANARGLSIYTLSEVASDKLSAGLAIQENRVDLLRGLDLPHVDKNVASILFDLERRETLNRSRVLQHQLVNDLSSRTLLMEGPARSANFAVLRSPSVPAMLIETGFLSNAADESLLRTPRYRRRLASLLAHALTDSLDRSAQL
jgi:N-acetylmuramoyl-L-alanine amidase